MEGARLSNQKQAEAESSKRGRPSSQNLGRKISRTKSVFLGFQIATISTSETINPAFLTHLSWAQHNKWVMLVQVTGYWNKSGRRQYWTSIF